MNKDNFIKIIKNFFWLILTQGAAYILPIFTLPILIQKLGIENYGYYSFFSALTLYLLTLVNYGFDLSGPTNLILNPESLNKIMSEIIFTKLLIFTFSAILGLIFVIFFDFVKLDLKWLILIILIQVLSSVVNLDWFFIGKSNFLLFGIYNSIIKLIFAISIFLGVKNAKDISFVVIVESISYSVIVFVSFFLVAKKFNINIYIPKFHSILSNLSTNSNIFITRVCLSIITSGNILILGLLKSPSEVGVYSSADKLIVIFLGIAAVFSKALLPIQTKVYLENKKNYWQYFIKITSLIFLLFLVLSIILFLFSDIIFINYLKFDNPNSKLIFKILLLYTPFFSIGAIITNSFIINSKSSYMTRPFIELLFLNVTLALVLIYFWGGVGLASAIIISWIFIIVKLLFIHKKICIQPI